MWFQCRGRSNRLQYIICDQSARLGHTLRFFVRCQQRTLNLTPNHCQKTATTTVSRLFTDKSGAVSTTESSPAVEINTSPRKRPTLLQRLHIITSAKRVKSPESSPQIEKAPSVAGLIEDYTGSPVATQSNALYNSNAGLADITRIMPQSMSIGSVHDSGSSTKRERSDDSRDVQGKAAGTVANRANGLLSKPIVKIPSYLDKSKGEISQAFQDLEWKQRFRLFHALENPNTSPFRVDRSEIVINRNRYGNVQPWDNCRVKLETPLDGSDYVNASPITLRSRAITKRQNSTDSISESSQESRYIATQGPKDVSTTHFWHMVMQQTIGDTGVVIMLTQCYESSREKCSQYYPLSLDNPTILLSPDEYADLESSQETVKAGTSSEGKYLVRPIHV